MAKAMSMQENANREGKKRFFQLGAQVGGVPKSLGEPGHRDLRSRPEQDCVGPLTAPGRMVRK